MKSGTDYTMFIDSTLQEASRLALQYFGKVSGTIKEHDSNQVLTEADLKVGAFLVSGV